MPVYLEIEGKFDFCILQVVLLDAKELTGKWIYFETTKSVTNFFGAENERKMCVKNDH